MAVIQSTLPNTLLSGTNDDDTIQNGGYWYESGKRTWHDGGSNVKIDARASNDSIRNYGSDVSIDAGAGNDSIYNAGLSVTIDAAADNDSISNDGSSVTIDAGEGNDSIYNYSYSSLTAINAWTGNDYIYNSGSLVTIDAEAGNDEIFNRSHGSLTAIDAGEGNDSIDNWGNSVTINAGTGKDSIRNYGLNVSIDAGADNDSIRNYGSEVSIDAGTGDDSIYNASLSVTIDAGADNDSISNDGSSVTIEAGEGNDSIYNYSYSSLTAIDAGVGNDYIYNSGSLVTIDAKNGNDCIYNRSRGSLTAIDAGTGNDSIRNYGSSVTIDAGTGNDEIFNNCYRKDDGSIYYYDNSKGYGSKIVFKYSEGDGNDTIWGFKKNSTLSIGGGSYSTTKSGDDIIITVGDGSISLVGAASLSAVNIVGKETVTETNAWKLNGTTATYGTSSNTLITVSGVKSLDGLSLKDKVVTIAASALNKSKVTISNGYTLKLASDVSTTAATSNSWSYKNSVATYKQTKGEKYSLASDGKTISYSKGTSSTLATVSGVKSADGLSVSGKVITVAQASLNQAKVTLSGSGYKLKFASDVTKTTTKKAAWSLSGSTVSYKSSYKTAGYTLASNSKSISYSAGTTTKTLAKVIGVKSKSGLKVSGKVINVPDSIISSKKVTVNGSGYEFKFAAQKTLITGSANADIITSTGANSTINGGAGNDLINIGGANNVIVYKSGDGSDTITNYTEDDTIKITSGTAKATTSGSDVVFTVGKGSIILKDAADKTVSYISNGTKKTFSATSSDEPYTVSGKGVTLSSSYSKELFDVSDLDNGDKIVTIDGSAVTHKLRIKGNDLANKIIGGSAGSKLDGGRGGSTLVGGDGSDTFIYYDGDGNNVISGYDAKDTITIEEGVVSTIKSSREDVVFQVGDGKITVRDVKGTRISFVEDGIEYGCLNGKRTLTISKTNNDTIATLSKNYWKDSFDVTKIGNEDVGNSITKIYASSVARTLKITGNAKSNQILGSSTKANTITGGGGNDTLQGGSGADVFVYAAGDGNDSIVGYDTSDKISITSGTVENVNVNADNDIILTIGAGKIILDNAGGKKLTYYDDTHRKETFSEIISPSNVVENWFVADDNNFLADNNLSALVQSNSADYSLAEVQTSLSSAKDLATLTYSSKK